MAFLKDDPRRSSKCSDEESIVVTEDTNRHVLSDAWLFYVHRVGGSSYEDGVVALGVPICTIEDFWGYYNNIPDMSSMLHPLVCLCPVC